MLMVKIYGIVNPLNDDVLYIGASVKPNIRHHYHSKGKSWENREYLHRQKEVLKMKKAGVVPELLILDEVDFPDVPFFEEFYMQLFKTWGYNIQQTRSGYQTNKKFFNDEEKVYIPKFNFFGIVVHNEDEMIVKVFIEKTQRVMSFGPYELLNMREYHEEYN